MDLFNSGSDSEGEFDPFDLSHFRSLLHSPAPSSPSLSSIALSPINSTSPLPVTHPPVLHTAREATPRADPAPELHDDDSDSDDEWLAYETGGISTSTLRYPKGRDSNDNPWMIIVDITGVHHLPVHFCNCATAAPQHIQLLQLRMYPVSYDRPRTAFTFRILDDFNLDNLETKSSAQRYYAKITRLTSNAFPQSVPDRYREFTRVIREWRNIELRKHSGVFGKDAGKDIPRGGLVSFCPACPQPGINLPNDWKEDKDQ